MLHQIKQFWNYAANVGITDALSPIERSKISMINKISAAMIINDIAILFFLYCFTDILLTDIGTVFFACVIKFLYFGLRHYQYHQLASLFIFFFYTFLTLGLTLYYGPILRIENLYVISILYISIIYNDLKKCLMGCAWVVLLFVIGRFYYTAYGVLMPAAEYQLILAELEARGNIVFVVLIILTVVIVNWYVREISTMHEKSERYLGEINVKNHSLSKINGEMERFAYIASHDLKTPLRTVVSFLGIIERKLEKKEYNEIDEYLKFAQDGATQMHHLITDILEYSRLSSSETDKSLVDLNEIFDTVKQQFKPVMNECKILKDQPLPILLANKAKMKTLFQNLIENGLKYNEKDQPIIVVSSKETKKEVILEFIDNGIGIDQKYKAKIFEMFRRLHTNRDYQGTGIGLAICKKIVESMNGIIDVKNGEVEGSVFTVNIPKAV